MKLVPDTSDPVATLVFFLFVFTVVGVVFLFMHLVMGSFIRPRVPDAEKLTIYECGEPTVGSAWIQFDLRFYVVALLFVIFDVEVAFFFPWATVFGKANQLAQIPSLTAADQKLLDTRVSDLVEGKLLDKRESELTEADKKLLDKKELELTADEKELLYKNDSKLTDDEQKLRNKINPDKKRRAEIEADRSRRAEIATAKKRRAEVEASEAPRNKLSEQLLPSGLSKATQQRLGLAKYETKFDDEGRIVEVRTVAPIDPATAAAWAQIAFWDILVFFGVLLVGFAYVWRRGDIDWVRAFAHHQEPAVDAEKPMEQQKVLV